MEGACEDGWMKNLTYQKAPGLNKGTTRLSRLLTSTPRKYPWVSMSVSIVNECETVGTSYLD